MQDSSSLSIASPTYQASPEMTTTCSWQISTREGYILQLVFRNLTISKCDETCCPYRYIQARDGNGLRDSLLGTYCGGNYPSEVSTTGNQIYVKYYGLYSNDTFEATVLSYKGSCFFFFFIHLFIQLIRSFVRFSVRLFMDLFIGRPNFMAKSFFWPVDVDRDHR